MGQPHQAALDAVLSRMTPGMTSAERARLLSDALLDSGVDWRHEPPLEEVKQLFAAVMRADQNDLNRPAPLAL
jgi:hypothetical protein